MSTEHKLAPSTLIPSLPVLEGSFVPSEPVVGAAVAETTGDIIFGDILDVETSVEAADADTPPTWTIQSVHIRDLIRKSSEPPDLAGLVLAVFFISPPRQLLLPSSEPLRPASPLEYNSPGVGIAMTTFLKRKLPNIPKVIIPAIVVTYPAVTPLDTVES
ncbi:hypothetical protein TWF730_002654 [Orbilia blumenaviensis]|uniref:Uncharacterized protein n=1 Tax=Orbilia blumenaviensis TaxID=1796055 RepID=A0AAV9UBA6_9PEZI